MLDLFGFACSDLGRPQVILGGGEKMKLMKPNSFAINKGVLMVPLAWSCPIVGIYYFHISPFTGADFISIIFVTSVLFWTG